MSNAPKPPKQYKKPKLQTFGSISDLTAAGPAGNVEAGMNMMNVAFRA